LQETGTVGNLDYLQTLTDKMKLCCECSDKTVSSNKRGFMQFQNLIPHLSASLSLLEAQINEWDKQKIDSELLPSEREELKSTRSIILEMRKTINLFQLSNAKGDMLESHRLIQIFYGLLWMCRPSIHKTQEILAKNPSARDYTSRLASDLFSINKENAH
jgi:hypothetical protein